MKERAATPEGRTPPAWTAQVVKREVGIQLASREQAATQKVWKDRGKTPLAWRERAGKLEDQTRLASMSRVAKQEAERRLAGMEWAARPEGQT